MNNIENLGKKKLIPTNVIKYLYYKKVYNNRLLKKKITDSIKTL